MSALLLMLLTGPSSALAAPFLVHRFPVMASTRPHTQRAGGRLLYFVPYGDPRLWRTDGTPEGTVPLLSEGHPYGIRPLAPDDLATLGEAAYFVLPNEGPERRLWRSDGTAAGTVPEDILGPQTLAGGEQTLYFLAVEPGLFESALWKVERGSDGEVSAPMRIQTGAGITSTGKAVATERRVFFLASAFGVHTQLWTSDGSGFGELVFDFTHVLQPGTGGERIQETAGFGALIALYSAPYVYTGITSLWVSDGTTEGTVVIQEEPVIYDGVSVGPAFGRIGGAGGRLYFGKRASDDSKPRLWTSDGTPEGTRVVLDESLAGDRQFPDDPTAVIDVKGTGYFLAWKATAGAGRSGYALWETDGTATGTRPIADLPLSEHGLLPRDLGHAGDTFLFWYIGPGPFGGYGYEELWGLRPDGSTPGPALELRALRRAVARLAAACETGARGETSSPFLERLDRLLRRAREQPADAERLVARMVGLLRAMRRSAAVTRDDSGCRSAIARAVRSAVATRRGA